MSKTEKSKDADPRQEAWDAFLAKVEAQNPTIFALDKEAGRFDTIPEEWVG